MNNRKLKIGLLVNNASRISAFYNLVINELLHREYELVFIQLDTQVKEGKKSNKVPKNLPLLFLKILESRFFSIGFHPLKFIQFNPRFLDLPWLRVTNQSQGPFARLSEGDISRIKEQEFDILFRIGWGILKGDVLHSAKFGIWSLHHGDHAEYRGKPAVFWEMFHGKKVVGCMLQQLTEKLDDGRIIDSLVTGINHYSYYGSLRIVYLKSLDLVLDNLKKLENLEIRFKRKESLFYDRPLYTTPTFKDQLRFLGKIVYRNVARKISRPRIWHIAIAKQKEAFSIRNYKTLTNNAGFFSADPFVVDHNNASYIFFEEAGLKNSKGHISFLNIDNPKEKGIALKEEFHLSFPHIFSDSGELYMIPETRGASSIRLYRCVEFPEKWELDSVLMHDISACDSVILREKDIYYLFTNVNNSKGIVNSDNLHLYFSENLRGPYQPHPINPITRDCRKSRNAGSILTVEGDLYRISQNAEDGYGSKVVLNRILTLNKQAYEEEQTQTIEGRILNAKAMHTFTRSNRYAAIDILI